MQVKIYNWIINRTYYNLYLHWNESAKSGTAIKEGALESKCLSADDGQPQITSLSKQRNQEKNGGFGRQVKVI